MAEDIIIGRSDDGAGMMDVMTEEQMKAYDEFIDYMVQLYKDYSYLTDDEGKKTEGPSG